MFTKHTTGVLMLGFAGALSTTSPVAGDPWRSELYPDAWTPPTADTACFETGKLIQDFSYAGYARGEKPLPQVTGPVFTAPDFGADPSGERDSTEAIQRTIDAAAQAGGGVVMLPKGTYRLSVPEDRRAALEIAASSIILRGAGANQTFLLNTTIAMRQKSIVRVAGPTSAAWRSATAPAARITADLMGPTRVIPIDDGTAFQVGDWVVVRTDVTPEWVAEHREPEWLGHERRLGGLAYFRRITAVDAQASTIVVDAPTRYYLKRRDNARVCRAADMLHDVGLEHFAIGNLEHPGKGGWGEEDYRREGLSAWEVHGAQAIGLERVRDSWICGVRTFQPAANTSTSHLPSNGIVANYGLGLTISDCHFQRPQYGGGGGNGYMFRLTNCNESLVRNSVAEFSRHGFVLSSMASSGNVFHRCIDRTTGRATGASGSMRTNGRSSDHHMHFSHSNLIDACVGDDSWWQAAYRPWGSEPKHNLTAAHSVFWNTRGEGTSAPNVLVECEQSRYGYVIGTSGPRHAVRTSGRGGAKTNPADHVEGVGIGDTLRPASLFLDQRARRLGTDVPEG